VIDALQLVEGYSWLHDMKHGAIQSCSTAETPNQLHRTLKHYCVVQEGTARQLCESIVDNACSTWICHPDSCQACISSINDGIAGGLHNGARRWPNALSKYF
jgi:hypothetical protein